MLATSDMRFVNGLDWRALGQALARWIARLAGLDVLPPGCRPVPVGNQDFDPQIAAKTSVSCAVAYAMILKWIKSNATNGRERYFRDGRWWTMGTHQQFADYAGCMSASTWARAVRDLVGAGLIEQRKVGKLMAYAPVSVQIDGDRRQNDEDAVQVAGDAPQLARPNKEDSKQANPLPELNTPAAIPARAAAGAAKPNREGIDNADKDGQDELMALIHSREVVAPPGWAPILPPLPGEFPPPPVAPPPSPDEPVTTEIDEPTEDGEDTREDWALDELRAIWPGTDDDGLRRLRERYGMEAIRAQRDTVAALPNVKNPPGLTLFRLRMGVPMARARSQGYTDGAYAGFIES